MRVTSRSIVDNVVRQLQQNAQALDKIQSQVTSGKRITRVSDDPAAAWRALRLRREHAGNDQLLRNLDEARNWLAGNDRVLQGATDTIARVRELAVQGADDAYAANDRIALADQVKQLKEATVALFNDANHIGQSLFSGRRTDLPPFTLDSSGNVRYAGETGVNIPPASSDLTATSGIEALSLTDSASATPGTYRVSVAAAAAGTADVTMTRYDSLGVAVPGATETVTVTVPAAGALAVVDFSALGLTLTANDALGATAFAESPTSQVSVSDAAITREIGSGVNLPVNLTGSKFLSFLNDLKSLETALRSASQPAIAKGIADMDRHLETVLVAQAEVGTRLNRVEDTEQRLREADLEVTRVQTATEDADPIETLTRLTTQQMIYRTALETSARVVPMSILDFLR
ncbi:MAG TPA: flagellar hook-associated protein FlgL [Chloroflexota bacterium]|nr:flagellar hook-associated protein FlgL [Chloroflexota bacterium]